MIPLGDDNPVQKKPYVVYVLIALNVLVYLVDRVGASGMFGNLFNFSMIPQSVMTNQPAVLEIPVRVGPFVQMRQIVHQGLDPQWLTIFTSMFMHGSVMHIAGNMLYLWIFGNNIEDALGHVKFVVFYLVCGVLAALAHIFSDVNSTIPTVGASGAIAGVLGAYLLVYPHARVRTLIMLGFFWDFVEIPAIFVLGVWFLIQLTGTLGSGGLTGGGVAYWAHVGGFVAGVIIIALLGGRKLARPSQRSFPAHRRSPYPWRPWK